MRQVRNKQNNKQTKQQKFNKKNLDVVVHKGARYTGRLQRAAGICIVEGNTKLALLDFNDHSANHNAILALLVGARDTRHDGRIGRRERHRFAGSRRKELVDGSVSMLLA